MKNHDNCDLTPTQHADGLQILGVDYEEAIAEVVRLRELAVASLEHFTTREVAAVMGISPATLTRWKNGSRKIDAL